MTALKISGENCRLVAMTFGLKLNIPAKPICEEEAKHFYRRLRSSMKIFRKTQFTYDYDRHLALIIEPQNRRQILLESSAAHYIERKTMNPTSFKNVAKSIYEFYLESKKVKLEDIRLVGKVFEYEITLGEDPVAFLQRRFQLLTDRDLREIRVRSTIVENNFNLHFTLQAKTGEDDEEEEQGETIEFITVKIDINNHDQTSGLKSSDFQHIIKYADDFNKDELYQFLEKQLSPIAK